MDIDIDAVLPRVTEWVLSTEAEGLREGRELTEQEWSIANMAGVTKPGRVRLIFRDSVPKPTDPVLLAAATKLGLDFNRMAGLTLGHAVFLRHGADLGLIAHELRHVAQSDTRGRDQFIQQYLDGLYKYGYWDTPDERDAREFARRWSTPRL